MVKNRIIGRNLLAACVGLCLTTQALFAREIAMVVQRLDNGTEIYLSAPAPTLFDSFATDPAVVPMDAGFVAFDAFFEGTWDVGDALMAGAHMTIGAVPAHLEAMSFMLHPVADKLPLRTRMDGMIAIGVCNAIEDGARYRLDGLQAYVGYYSDVGSVGKPLDMKLPAGATEPVTLRVHDIAVDGRSRSSIHTLAPGDTLRLPPHAAPTAFLGIIDAQRFAPVLAVLAVLSGCFVALRIRRA